jgi:hypothetical protein
VEKYPRSSFENSSFKKTCPTFLTTKTPKRKKYFIPQMGFEGGAEKKR